MSLSSPDVRGQQGATIRVGRSVVMDADAGGRLRHAEANGRVAGGLHRQRHGIDDRLARIQRQHPTLERIAVRPQTLHDDVAEPE